MTPNATGQPEGSRGPDASEKGVCGGGVPTPPRAILLAAGQSKRMKSDLVKVLHKVCGRPMLSWVLDACKAVGCDPIYVVIGHQGDEVRRVYADDPSVKFVEQRERLGTGHAVQQVEPWLREFEGDVIVLAGDGPLIRASTLRALLERHRAAGAAASLATSTIDDPSGYGRIDRDEAGEFEAIVEEKDATETQRRIREINPSYYCFRSPDLFESLRAVSNTNASGEYYLTDVLAILRSKGRRVAVADAAPPEDVLSVNTPEQLEAVSAILSARLAAAQEAES